MLIDPSNFENLIIPISGGEFFEQYWETKPIVLTQRGATGYKGLLSLKEIEFLLTTRFYTEKDESVRFIRNKQELSRESYLKEGGIGLDRDKVLKGFIEGNTIVLNFLDKYWEPVRALSSKLVSAFECRCNVNAYLTPPASQGFDAHFDDHDVFILQLEGKKRWKIYKELFPFPAAFTSFSFREKKELLKQLGDPLYEVSLEPGDFLYIPRGWGHEAAANEEHSLHLTVGMHPFTWVDFFYEIMKEIPELRRALPRGALSQNVSCKDRLQMLLSACEDPEALVKARNKLNQKFNRAKPTPFHFGLVEAAHLKKLNEETLFKKREGVGISLETEELKIAITVGDKKISGPSYFLPTLESIIEHSFFSMKTLPNHLTSVGKRNLILSLMRAGFLEIVHT